LFNLETQTLANIFQNFAMMSEFMTELGKIKHSRDTGLRPVNQRKVAKAVRRAIGLGLMPSVHRHPEILTPRTALGR
jgi:small subunit ribosomal protein S18